LVADGNFEPPPDDKSLGDLVTQVSENASLLIREEIELAKAGVEQKVRSIARGAIVGAVAGVFLLFALIYLLEAAAWGLNDVFDSFWLGFLIVGGALVALALIGALIAVRSLRSGTPPTPEQAIEEARLIREALEHPDVQAAAAESRAGKAAE
jgi:high-affinity Fe2+/Pb2+ permease